MLVALNTSLDGSGAEGVVARQTAGERILKTAGVFLI
jgi:hypothetical protein